MVIQFLDGDWRPEAGEPVNRRRRTLIRRSRPMPIAYPEGWAEQEIGPRFLLRREPKLRIMEIGLIFFGGGIQNRVGL